MAPKIYYEVYDTEQDLEAVLNSEMSKGLTPISIYQIPSKRPQGYEIVIWWKAEDSYEG
jgi:hypothetical protein